MRVVTIGNFDGVHHGHCALVERARVRAEAGSGGTAKPSMSGFPDSRVVAVTFDPHPLRVLRPESAPDLLTLMPRRTELLVEAGADEVVVLPFTRELSGKSPEEFARLLRDDPAIAADVVVVGENFRFGKGAAGTTTMLTDLGERLGFEVDIVPLVSDGPEAPLSSSHIRACIARGDMAAATHALGRPHRLEGPVVRGDARGRELGYPTANVDVSSLAVPPDGVYAAWLMADGERYPAAVSIGTNPQFDGRERRVEAYVLDRDDLDLYDHHVALDLVARLRGQEVFPSVADLVAQMGRDVAAARAALAG